MKLVQIHRTTLVDVDRLKGVGHELFKASCKEAARRQLDGRSLGRLSAATECESGAMPAGRGTFFGKMYPAFWSLRPIRNIRGVYALLEFG